MSESLSVEFKHTASSSAGPPVVSTLNLWEAVVDRVETSSTQTFQNG